MLLKTTGKVRGKPLPSTNFHLKYTINTIGHTLERKGFLGPGQSNMSRDQFCTANAIALGEGTHMVFYQPRRW